MLVVLPSFSKIQIFFFETQNGLVQVSVLGTFFFFFFLYYFYDLHMYLNITECKVLF